MEAGLTQGRLVKQKPRRTRLRPTVITFRRGDVPRESGSDQKTHFVREPDDGCLDGA
jgi:hypothetical protein